LAALRHGLWLSATGLWPDSKNHDIINITISRRDKTADLGG
jgi:hypothetical protein